MTLMTLQTAVMQASQVESRQAKRESWCHRASPLFSSPIGSLGHWRWARPGPGPGQNLRRPTLANSDTPVSTHIHLKAQCLCTSPRCRHAVHTLSPARLLTTVTLIHSVPARRALRETSPARPSCHRHAKPPDLEPTRPRTRTERRNTRCPPRRPSAAGSLFSDVAVCPERGPRTIRRWSQGTPELPSTLLPTPAF